MSTLIQTCLESQYMETSSQVLKLNIIDDQFMKSNVYCAANVATTDIVNGNGNGRSFLQFLSNISSSTPKENMEKENVYFHPLSKSTSSRLSEKSLQLCTENLGCETGCTTDFIMDTTTSLSSSSSSPYNNYSSRNKEQEVVEEKKEEEGSYSHSYSYSIKKVKSYSAFPPPLTTMSGEKSLQIRTNREGGRLITKAFEIPCQESCFVADRSDGRLRLRVFNKDIVDHDDEQVIMSPQEENIQDEVGKEIVDENEMIYKEEHVNECQINDVNVVVAADDDDDDDDNDEDADDDDGYGYDGENSKKLIVMSKEIVVGSSYDIVEVEKMGKEKFPRRLVRCKECSKGLGNNWEPLWVATS